MPAHEDKEAKLQNYEHYDAVIIFGPDHDDPHEVQEYIKTELVNESKCLILQNIPSKTELQKLLTGKVGPGTRFYVNGHGGAKEQVVAKGDIAPFSDIDGRRSYYHHDISIYTNTESKPNIEAKSPQEQYLDILKKKKAGEDINDTTLQFIKDLRDVYDADPSNIGKPMYLDFWSCYGGIIAKNYAHAAGPGSVVTAHAAVDSCSDKTAAKNSIVEFTKLHCSLTPNEKKNSLPITYLQKIKTDPETLISSYVHNNIVDTHVTHPAEISDLESKEKFDAFLKKEFKKYQRFLLRNGAITSDTLDYTPSTDLDFQKYKLLRLEIAQDRENAASYNKLSKLLDPYFDEERDDYKSEALKEKYARGIEESALEAKEIKQKKQSKQRQKNYLRKMGNIFNKYELLREEIAKCSEPTEELILKAHNLLNILLDTDIKADKAIGASLPEPIHIAIEKSDWSLVELLIARTTNINAQDIDGNTPLHLLIKSRWNWCAKIDGIKALLARGADINITNNEAQSALHICALESDYYSLEELLKSPNINLDLCDKHGITPLTYAVGKETARPPRTVTALLQKGANPHAGEAGLTALSIAVKCKPWLTKFLFEHSAKEFIEQKDILPNVTIGALDLHGQTQTTKSTLKADSIDKIAKIIRKFDDKTAKNIRKSDFLENKEFSLLRPDSVQKEKSWTEKMACRNHSDNIAKSITYWDL